MCRDPGDTTSKVSCCVEPSSVLKITILMLAYMCPSSPLKMSLTQKQSLGCILAFHYFHTHFWIMSSTRLCCVNILFTCKTAEILKQRNLAAVRLAGFAGTDWIITLSNALFSFLSQPSTYHLDPFTKTLASAIFPAHVKLFQAHVCIF